MNFRRNQNQASISQPVHHNADHVPDPSHMSADAKHFCLLDWRSNIPLNRNTNQENFLHTNTIK